MEATELKPRVETLGAWCPIIAQIATPEASSGLPLQGLKQGFYIPRNASSSFIDK